MNETHSAISSTKMLKNQLRLAQSIVYLAHAVCALTSALIVAIILFAYLGNTKLIIGSLGIALFLVLCFIVKFLPMSTAGLISQ